MSRAVLPSVTVVIPTYNRAGYLRRALDSVLSQSYSSLAILVPDNASTDDTSAVVAGYADPRVRYLRRPENIGWLSNFNESLKLVDTEYVTILGDDDIMLPDSLARSTRILEQYPNVGMVHSAFNIIGAEDEVLTERADWTQGLTEDTLEDGAEFIRRSMLASCRVCSPSSVMRSAALPALVYDPADDPAADFSLWLRMALDWDLYFLVDPLINHRIHATSTSAGWGDVTASGYLQGFGNIMNARATKLRFLENFADRLPDRERLRHDAYRAARWEFVDTVRGRTMPDRKLLSTVRLLGEAARLDPRVFLEGYTWRLVGAAALGPRIADRVKEHERPRTARAAS